MIYKLLTALRLSCVVVVLTFATVAAQAQLLTWSPSFVTESDNNVQITADATRGNQDLQGHAAGDVYVHIGVITTVNNSPTAWRFVQSTWGSTNPNFQATSVATNQWRFTIPGNLRTYFGITDPNERILRIAILFRSGNGSRVLRNADGSDMYVPVYQPGLHARIDRPFREPKFTPTPELMNVAAGANIPITGNSSEPATLTVRYNGTQVATASNVTTISTNGTAVTGDNQIILTATNANGTRNDTLNFFVNTPVNVAPQPAGTVDGINYHPDNTTVTLVLYAPNKTRAAVIGDFNNWTQSTAFQMNRTPDGLRYWITISGLTPGEEYAYQYVIDNNLFVADIFAEKILDPWNDQWIPAVNYPNLKPYPAGQTNIVSVLQTAKPTYNWMVPNFTRPDKRNLIIYELLVRDFIAAQNWQTLRDTLSYLKRLGVNALKIMPFNEFEGNNSWGYNPMFYFAPDKMYGTEDALKQFIDVCHQNGIAVIMDIALNHAFGLSPTVRMYWDAANSRPASNSAWHNPIATHPFNVGFDFNHEAPATRDLTHRVIRHWLVNYKIDGFRWDLSKGFTQVNSGSNVGAWSNYDASRVTIWKRIYDSMQQVSPGSYCILEHFAANNEETELANYGMLLWGNLNHAFNEATMGYVSSSNFEWGLHTVRGWNAPHLITYQESHDEERLMFRNLNFGNMSGSYNTRNLATALKRMEMSTAFWAMMPGPKMLWQFGELGYDQSINRCPDGTINNNCRTDPKPILWNYRNDPNRASLLNVYSRLFALRNHPAYLPTFITNNIQHSLGGAFKWMTVSTTSLRIVVVGNFDVVPVSGSVMFPTPGTWFNFLNGGTFNATGSWQNMTLQPGEFYVYLDRDANAVLPLTLLNFDGIRETEGVKLSWRTLNENNVSHFEVERSLDGTSFSRIAAVNATNHASGSQYSSIDASQQAVAARENIFYRLKMVDKDGTYSYSKVVMITPGRTGMAVSVYPNPVKGGRVFIKIDGTTAQRVSMNLQDAAGKILKAQHAAGVSGNLSLDVSGIAAGVYFLKLTIDNQTSVYPLVIN